MVVNMEKKRKNIVWFCTDQQRWDTIHSLGNPYIHTPNIDRLVKEGVAFTRAYTHAQPRLLFNGTLSQNDEDDL